MNQSCSHKIARLLAVLICCALLAGCKGKEQEDVFPDIAHYTVPEQNSMCNAILSHGRALRV